VNTI